MSSCIYAKVQPGFSLIKHDGKKKYFRLKFKCIYIPVIRGYNTHFFFIAQAFSCNFVLLHQNPCDGDVYL